MIKIKETDKVKNNNQDGRQQNQPDRPPEGWEIPFEWVRKVRFIHYQLNVNLQHINFYGQFPIIRLVSVVGAPQHPVIRLKPGVGLLNFAVGLHQS